MAGQKAEVDKLKLVQELEMEMMNDMYNRLVSVCHGKCINTKYSEGEIAKGEAVCLDRCVAKFLETHDKVGKKLTSLTVQDEEMMKRMQS